MILDPKTKGPAHSILAPPLPACPIKIGHVVFDILNHRKQA